MTNPLSRFVVGLKAIKQEFNDEIDEMIGFAEILANKRNTLELDDDGFFYTSMAGPLDEIIPVIEEQLTRLKRIRKQKENGG